MQRPQLYYFLCVIVWRGTEDPQLDNCAKKGHGPRAAGVRGVSYKAFPLAASLYTIYMYMYP